MRFALVVFAFALSAAAQVEPGATGQVEPSAPAPAVTATKSDPNAAQKPPEKGHIIGRVTNEITGDPLKKATVEAWPTEGQDRDTFTAASDESGKFHVDELEPGKYSLHASRNGYVGRSYGGSSGGNGSGTILTVGPGGTVEANFKLTPQSVVTGRIVDEDGEAVANAHVKLLRYQWRNGKRALSPGGNGSTNDLGEYRMFGISPGKYFLSVNYNPNQFSMSRAAADAPDADYPTIYYPGSVDPQGATKIEVPKSGQLNGVDMKLLKARSYRVSGKVSASAPGNEKPGRVMVRLMPKSQDLGGMWESNRMTQTDANGAFEFRGVMPGAYELSGNAFGEESVGRGRADVSVEQSNVAGVMLKLTSGWEMKGTVRVEGNTAPTGLNLISFVFLNENAGPMMFSAPPSAKPKDDGSVTFKNIGPERLQLHAWNLPDGYYIKSARAGSANLMDGPVDMAATQGAAIDIVLSPKGGVAEGSVKNDKDEAVTTGTVVLVPEAAKRSNHDLFRETPLDQYGRYKISGIPPGSYTLYAFQAVENGIWEDSDYLKTIENDAVAVKLEESGHESNDLKVIVGAEN